VGVVMNEKAERWYLEGCPRGWAGVLWIIRAGIAESIFGLALWVAPRGYRASWDRGLS